MSLRKALMEASANAVRSKLPTKLVKGNNIPSAYILFGKDERPKLTGMTGKPTEVMKELGQRWKGLDDAAKKPYQDRALKNKAEAAGVEETPVLRVKGEAKLEKFAKQASSAAIQGFFSGLTDLSEDDLKGKGASMTVTGAGTLKVVRTGDGKFEVMFTPQVSGSTSP